MTGHDYRFVVLSVMGPHAGEDEETIFSRKIADTRRCGRTFWLVRSNQASPPLVQNLASEAQAQVLHASCLFVAPSSPEGARPTEHSAAAELYSPDGQTWTPFPKLMTPVTGKIDRSAYALVFDELSLVPGEVDLWRYTDFKDPSQPIRFRLGASTVCALKGDTDSHPHRMRSHVRRVVAVGRLCLPFAVWVR
jgi:hypothetical protein